MGGSELVLPGFKPSINNTVYLVGTAADAARMGGTANRVYSTFQTAYDAAAALQVVLGGTNKVALFVQETTAAQVGNLTLAANWNTNVKLIGKGANVSEVGTIIASNASGNGFSVGTGVTANNYFSVHLLKVGTINTSATGATGNSGTVFLAGYCVNIGVITTSATNASNTTGTGGNISITQSSTDGLLEVISPSYFAGITQAAQGAVSAGSLTILHKNSVFGPMTLGGGAVTKGVINIECDQVTNITCTTTATITFNLKARRHIGNTLPTLANASTMTIEDCEFTVQPTFAGNGDGTTQPNVYINRCKLNLMSFTNQIPKVTFSYCQLGISSQASVFTTSIGNNCIFRNCYMTVTHTFTSFIRLNGATGVEFHNCILNTSSTNIIESATPVTIKVFNCFFTGAFSGVTPLGEREFQTSPVTTTDATPTTIFTIPIPTGNAVKVMVDVMAVSTNDRYTGKKTNILKNVAGTVTKVTATDVDIMTPISDAALNTCTFETVVSGTNLLVQVTGIAATSIIWVANIKATTQ